MVRLLSQNNKTAYDLTTYIVDTEENLENLNVSVLPMGTKCYAIEEQTEYILNSQKEWIKK